MSVDYDRLRKLADKATPGPWWFRDFSGAEHPSWDITTEDGNWIVEDSDPDNGPLIALAPNMACELLRLHDGMESALTEMHDIATALRRIENHNVAFAVEQCASLLTRILEGDNQ